MIVLSKKSKIAVALLILLAIKPIYDVFIYPHTLSPMVAKVLEYNRSHGVQSIDQTFEICSSEPDTPKRNEKRQILTSQSDVTKIVQKYISTNSPVNDVLKDLEKQGFRTFKEERGNTFPCVEAQYDKTYYGGHRTLDKGLITSSYVTIRLDVKNGVIKNIIAKTRNRGL